MTSFSMGWRPAVLAVALLLSGGLAACTTVEGTNALTDVGTFEREVMSETLRGLGGLPRDQKEENMRPRGPLVLPKNANTLPAPQPRTEVASLPQNSDQVQIDASGLSEQDVARLRNARVVDLRSLSGRPLTAEETRKLTSRMTAAQMQVRSPSGPRPLYLPPDQYFTTVAGRDTVCLAANGDVVPVNDPNCPAEVRNALRR